jgi:hypothetical protein
MHQKLYLFGNFFLALTLVAGLLQSIIHFQLGPNMFKQESFPSWFLVVNIFSMLGASFLLKYFHHKQYRFTLVAGTLAVLTTLGLSLVTYLLLMVRAPENWYLPVLFLSLLTGMVYSASLIVPPAGKIIWLKSAGLSLLLINLLTGSSITWILIDPQIQTSGSLEKMEQWTYLVSSLVPLLFMMCFSQELKLLKTNPVNTSQPLFSESNLGVVGVIGVLTMLGFGVVFAHDSYMSTYWTKRNLEKSQELARLFEAHTFVGSQGDTLLYRLLKPLNYDPQKKYPLVVSLHHGGDHGSDNIRQTGSQPAAILSTEENRKKYPAFHFVPQCPQGSVWGGNSSYPAIDSLIFEAIYALEQEYAIDEKRRYLGGISGGGFGSWYFIGSRPKMFAAAIPICGGGNPSLAPNMVDVSVWAFHGEKDRLAPVSGSRDMIEAIKKAGGNPRYTEFPETGHNIEHLVINTPGLLDWLFAQKRN